VKRVVIFGGDGIVGRALAQRLSKNYQVVSLDRNFTSSTKESVNFQCHHVDILDFEQVSSFLQPEDIVFNLAAMSRVSNCNEGRLASMNINLVGAVHIMEAAEKAKASRLILASSLYANGVFGGFYSAGKRAMEQYALTYAKITALPITVLKLGSVAGPIDDTNSLPTRLIRRSAGIDNDEISINKDLLRDYLPLDGVIRGMEYVMVSADYINRSVEFFSGGLVSVETLLANVRSVTNKDPLEFIKLIEKEVDYADQYVTSSSTDRDFELGRLNIADYCKPLGEFLLDLHNQSIDVS
jgi:nucleoside-diphosphate-sugar epimerase